MINYIQISHSVWFSILVFFFKSLATQTCCIPCRQPMGLGGQSVEGLGVYDEPFVARF